MKFALENIYFGQSHDVVMPGFWIWKVFFLKTVTSPLEDISKGKSIPSTYEILIISYKNTISVSLVDCLRYSG